MMNWIHPIRKPGKFFRIVTLFVLFLAGTSASHSQRIQAQSLAQQTQIEAQQRQTESLRDALTVEGIMQHLHALQAIADENGNNRAAGTEGYQASVEYLVAALEAANYQVTLQPFTFDGYMELAPPLLSVQNASDAPIQESEYATLEYSGSGEVMAAIQAVDIMDPSGTTPNSSNSACELNDFATFQRGNVALIQRGTCPFAQKVSHAIESGAAAVLIFNEGQPGRTDLFPATLGEPIESGVPVLATSYALGLTPIQKIIA
ncbi:MAG: PA domain-containing protein [Chloroflexota bacterium]